MDFKKIDWKNFDWKNFDWKNFDWKNFCKQNAKYIAGGLAMFVLAVILIVGAVRGPEDSDNAADANTATDAQANASGGEKSEIISTKEDAKEQLENSPLEKDAYPEVNTLVASYFKDLSEANVDELKKIVDVLTAEEEEQIVNKKEYIEKYDNISCYTKPGPIGDSYIVFAYYETKFINIDTLVPGLMPLYVCTAEDGGLYVVNGDLDEDVQTYVATVREDQDVLNLVAEVNEKYEQAQASDASLKKFVAQLEAAAENTANSDQARAEAEADEAAKKAAEEEKKQQEEEAAKKKAAAAKKKEQTAADKKKASEEAATKAAQGASGRIVRLSGTVNVRARMSADSRLIFTCAPGDLVQVQMDYAEGWSKVTVYANGKVGYIKTMYLK